MEWNQAVKNKDGMYSIPSNWLKIEYFELFSILFRLENVLRVFVYSVLKNYKGTKWLETSIDFEEKSSGTIESVGKRRITQEQSMGYISYHISSYVMQLTLGELVAIMFSNANWDMFKDFFPGKKDIIKNKFLEIIEVRNALSHFRPIKNDDIQIVKQNITHSILKIESYLSKMTSANILVPTNHESSWYKEVNNYCAKNTKVKAFYSENEVWIRISVLYNCPVIESRNGPVSFIYKLLKLNTSSILHDFPSLYENCIYVTESSYSSVNDKKEISSSKNINFIFNEKTLSNDHSFFETLTKVIENIEYETDIILNEHTAQGKYVKSVFCKAKEYSGWCSTEYENLRNEVTINDPVEFWGDIPFNDNIVTHITKYPWMPVDFSDGDLF